MRFNIDIPSNPPPIFIIGAGGIVNTAHLPAYKLAGFKVKGIYDVDIEKATATAKSFGIPAVYKSIEEMLKSAPSQLVFDIAVPGSQVISILEQLPGASTVLIQKPMGENYDEAKKILELTRKKKMLAAVNFQLRYAPFIIEGRNMISSGMLGGLVDIEINVNVYTPWQLWDFLYSSPRVEMLYHSIHYIDLVRSFLGNPVSVYAKTVKHPAMKELASVRSTIIMDYGEMIRASILTNHCHVYGPSKQDSYIKLEGTKGAIKIGLGLLRNYPTGEADTFEYITMENGKYNNWRTKQIEGTWFPHAFIGSMSALMHAATGNKIPGNSVEDCIDTMACVEAAHESSSSGGTKLK
jgi:predicted dehydrogenase